MTEQDRLNIVVDELTKHRETLEAIHTLAIKAFRENPGDHLAGYIILPMTAPA